MINLEILRDNYARISGYLDRLSDNTPAENKAYISAILPLLNILSGNLERGKAHISERQVEGLSLLSNKVTALSEKVNSIYLDINKPGEVDESHIPESFFATLPSPPSENDANIHYSWLEKEIESCEKELRDPMSGDILRKLRAIKSKLLNLMHLSEIGEDFSKQGLDVREKIYKLLMDIDFFKIRELAKQFEIYFSDRPPILSSSPFWEFDHFIRSYSRKEKELQDEKKVIFDSISELKKCWELKENLEKFSLSINRQYDEINSIPLDTDPQFEGKLRDAIKAIQDAHVNIVEQVSNLNFENQTERNLNLLKRVRKFEENLIDKKARYNALLENKGLDPVPEPSFPDDIFDSICELEKIELNDNYDAENNKKISDLNKIIDQEDVDSKKEMNYWSLIQLNSESHDRAKLYDEKVQKAYDSISLLINFSYIKFYKEKFFANEDHSFNVFDSEKDKNNFFDLINFDLNELKEKARSVIPTPFTNYILKFEEDFHAQINEFHHWILRFGNLPREIDLLETDHSDESHLKSVELREKLLIVIDCINKTNPEKKDELLAQALTLKNKIDEIDFNYFTAQANKFASITLSQNDAELSVQWDEIKKTADTLQNKLEILKKDKGVAFKERSDELIVSILKNHLVFNVKALILRKKNTLAKMEESYRDLTNPQISRNVAAHNPQYASFFQEAAKFKSELIKELNDPKKDQFYKDELTQIINQIGILTNRLKAFLGHFNPPLN